MRLKDYTLLKAIKPKLSPKTYKRLVEEIELRENIKLLKEMGFEDEDF